MTLRTTSSKIIFVSFIAITLMASLSITTGLGTAAGFTQCSDGINNDPLQDDLIDSKDPGCHTDFNASNSSTYDPTLNSEINPSSPSGGGGGCSFGCGNPPPTNSTPTCSSASVTVTEGSSVNLNLNNYASDPNGDNLSYSYSNTPSGSLVTTAGAFSWSTNSNSSGNYTINYTASDGQRSCSSSIYLTVNDGGSNNNGSLSCTNPSFSVRAGNNLNFDLHNYISGNSSNNATFSIGNLPSGASFNSSNGEFNWNTSSNISGTYNLSYSAQLGVNSCTGNIRIDTNNNSNNNNDDLRVICEVDDRRVEIGESVRFSVDIDGGDRPYDIDWRGDISGDDETERVRFNRAGTYEVSVRVEDDDGDRDTDQCPDVIVGGGGNFGGSNFPYFTTTAPSSASQGVTYIYDSNAIDPDGSSIVYSLASGPSGLTINSFNGLIQWIPTAAQSNRSHLVQIRATDRDGDFAFQNFSVFVQGPTIIQPPIIQPPLPPIANLEIFDLRVDNDQFNNVIVSYRTNISANSRVHYSINSHFEDNSTANYENQVPGPSNTTFHQVSLGSQLEINRTYYLRAYAWTNNDTDLTSELAFVLLPGGIVAGTNNFTTTRNYRYVDEYALVRIIDTDGIMIGGRTDAGLASALAVIGAWLFSPWFLLLIIIILLVILLLRRGRDTYISSGGSGPVEIRS